MVSGSGGGALDPMGGPGPPESQHVGATFVSTIQSALPAHVAQSPLPVSVSAAAAAVAAAQVTSATPLGDANTTNAAATKWHSRENLLAPEEEGDPQLFVALYEFRAQGENQLTLRKGKYPTRLFRGGARGGRGGREGGRAGAGGTL